MEILFWIIQMGLNIIIRILIRGRQEDQRDKYIWQLKQEVRMTGGQGQEEGIQVASDARNSKERVLPGAAKGQSPANSFPVAQWDLTSRTIGG